ncbi:MAG TPA: tRNA lysidine(34) synthetase TilS [Pyrinomonadaceae bacterium]|nr:tRNA lysidine(34) synthetase TilS [Pyrinomonadaceae bacterium]
MSRFARSLLREWKARGWPTGGERVVVAVSGGADSTALMLALEELRGAGLLELKLVVAHMNHGLRGERGNEDARWVVQRAAALALEVVLADAEVCERARVERDNLEQAARRARYEFLSEVAREREARAVLVAHTLDDQAETVLLRLLRGSGADGLGGMRVERTLEDGGEVSLRRPLLGWARRADTEGYCRERGVEFRTDEMNEDERFARVRVRRRLLPLLESFNPRASEALSRAAKLLREDSDALDVLAARLLEEARAESSHGAGVEKPSGRIERIEGEISGRVEISPLRVGVLASAHHALRRRALRQWLAHGRGDLRRLELAHIAAVERLLEGTRGGRVAELPGGSRVERRRGLLIFHPEK